MKKPKLTKSLFTKIITEGPIIQFLVAIFSLRQIIAEPFILGQKFDWYLPLFNLRQLPDNAFYSWSIENTGSIAGYYSAWLGDLSFGLAGILGISPKIFIPLFLVVVLALASWGLTRLLRFFHMPWPSALLAGLFYMLAPTVYIRIIVGFLAWLLSYALAPFIILLFLKSLATKHWLVYGLWSGFWLALAAIQLQFLVMIGFILLIISVFKICSISTIQKITRLLIIFLIALIFQLPWLLTLFSRGFAASVNLFSQGSAVESAVLNLPHSMLRTIFLNEHHITLGLFDPLNHSRWFLAPGLIFLSLILLGNIVYWKKNALRFPILMILVIGLFITLLPHPHLAWIYTQLFHATKLINIFREVYHAQFLMSFAYSLAFGFASGILYLNLNHKSQKTALIIIELFFIGIFCQVQLKGNFKPFGTTFNPSAYQALYDEFKNLPQKSRVYYPLGLGFIKVDSGLGASNGDVLARSMNLSFLDEGSSNLNLPSNVTNVRNFMIHELEQKKSIDNFLRKFGTGFVVDRKDVKSLNVAAQAEISKNKNLKKYWQPPQVSASLNPLIWSKDSQVLNYDLYQNPANDKIYASSQVLLSAGDYQDLSQRADIIYLSEQNPKSSITARFPVLSSSKQDIEASLASQTNIIPYVDQIDKNIDALKGWSQGRFSWWYDESFSSIVSPFIFTRVPDNFSTKFNFWHTGFHKAYVRVWYSPKGGELSVGIGDKSTQINTKAKKSEWRWLVFNETIISKKNHELSLQAISGDQAVAEVIIIPFNEINQIDKKVKNILSVKKVQSYDTRAKIDFQPISPTRYKINITNQKSFLLIFAENYDPGWILKVNNKRIKPIVVNGWANGYYIDQSVVKSASLTYRPQIWYLLGLIMAGLTFLLILAFSIYKKFFKFQPEWMEKL